MASATAASGLGSSGLMPSLIAWLTVPARRRTIGRAVNKNKQRGRLKFDREERGGGEGAA